MKTQIPEPRFPRDDKGKAVPKECPKCGMGKLEYDSHGIWQCNGLMDPEDNEQPLEACNYFHEDGKPYDDLKKKKRKKR